MKKRDLIKIIESNGGRFLRDGGDHDIYIRNNKRTSVPRYREIDDFLAKTILKQLGIKA